MSKELTLTSNRFNAIITKAGDVNSLSFKTIDEKALTEITEWMPEVNRAVTAFNKQNSQTTSSLMSLNMIDAGPYRVLRQILAQAERKRSALNEVVYKLEMKKLRYKELGIKLDEIQDDIQRDKLDLMRNKTGCDIFDAQGAIEAAIKELGGLKRRYEEICKNKGIPEKWDEQDFEDAEIEHHIKSIFRNAIRDKMQGGCNMGTMEYMEQFGINPITGYKMVENYIVSVTQLIADKGIGPDIASHYEFLDRMHDIFKDSYKKAMARIGLDSITHSDFLMRESK